VILKLVLENLKHRPMRSLLSILLIGVPVTLILSLVGVSQGLSEDSQNRARGIGADIVMKPSTASAAISFSGAAIDERIIPKVEEQPHIRMAMGVIVQTVELPLTLMGVDIDKFNAMSGGFRYIAGHTLEHPDDILVDEYYAAQKNLQVGSTVKLLNHDWRVAGIVGSGKLARLVVDKRELQQLTASTGKVSVIYAKLDDPANTDAVVRQLRELLPSFGDGINSMEYYTSMFAAFNIPGVKAFTYVVIGIMYMAVLQRTREIGILKSLGGSKGFILSTILFESVMLGIGGTIFGILLSYVARWAIRAFVPASFPMVIVHEWWLRALLITLVGTTLGALYPGLNAAAHDPIEALAYE